MKITIISNFWPSYGRSGVALMSEYHVKSLIKMGHEVSIIGSNQKIINETVPGKKIYLESRGSGAIYSPRLISKYKLSEIIKSTKPDLVILEGWQTALTECSIHICYEYKIKVVMISHGISIHPFSRNLFDIFRSIMWLYYRSITLPTNIKKLSLITTMGLTSKSTRFYDRDLSIKYKIPILPLNNTAINYKATYLPRHLRKNFILVIGYYSRVKNQLGAIRLMLNIASDITMKLVGKKEGQYYEECKLFVKNNKLDERVQFLDDSECIISHEIQTCLVVLLPSLTEAQPLTLLESMASGTPFISTPVGAIPCLRGGIIKKLPSEWLGAINLLTDKDDFVTWTRMSQAGLKDYEMNYMSNIIEEQLSKIISRVVKVE